MLTAEEVRRFVSYNPFSGVFTWNFAFPDMFQDGTRTKEMRCRMFNGRYAGRPAFTAVNGNGYYSAVIGGTRTAAHRIAWLWVYGELPDVIDHINGDKLDNRISNLRSVTRAENSRNMMVSDRNRSGFVGVRYQQSRRKWSADIRYKKKLHFLGRFDCLGKALHARREAEINFGFHENHGKR